MMILDLVAATGLSALLVGAVRWYALRRGVLDEPNQRSSHSVPTPRGGGLGLVLAFGAVVAASRGMLATVSALLAVLAVMLVGLVGWLDDHGGLSARWRFAVHLVAGLLLLPLVSGLPGPVPLGALAGAWWVVWTVSSINVVNFMDGIDGIIAVQGVVFGVFVGVMGAPGGAAQAIGFLLAAACLGFLPWNWSPARIFLGDVGSGMLGALFVVVGALLVAEGRVGFVAAFAPLIPIFLDATATLIARARRGERLSEAHRTHLYQRLANRGPGHAPVTIGYGFASVAAALWAAQVPDAGLPALLLPLGLTGGVALLAHAGLRRRGA